MATIARTEIPFLVTSSVPNAAAPSSKVLPRQPRLCMELIRLLRITRSYFSRLRTRDLFATVEQQVQAKASRLCQPPLQQKRRKTRLTVTQNGMMQNIASRPL